MKKLAVIKRMMLKLGLAAAMLAVPIAGSVMTVEAASSSVKIDAKHFPDKTFRNYVKGFDKNKNGALSKAERSKVKTIVLSSMAIKDLKGIEYFTNLTELSCRYNQLKKLDVSNCSNLHNLDCGENVQVIGYGYED